MKTSTILIGGSVLLVAIYAYRKSLATGEQRSVTKTGFAGGTDKSVVTTPIKSPAIVAPKSTLDLLLESGGRIFQRVAGLVLPAKTDARTAYGNVASSSAAYTSPLRPEYRQSAYSK